MLAATMMAGMHVVRKPNAAKPATKPATKAVVPSLAQPVPWTKLIDAPNVAKCGGPISVAGRYTCSRALKQDVEVKAEVIGQGKTVVRLGKKRLGGERCAVKSLSKVNRSKRSMNEIKNEAELHLEMDHPNVLRLEGIYETPTDVHLVTEYLGGGELFDHVAPTGGLPEAEAARIFDQMLAAVTYMHGRGILHLDLKLENFMYHDKDKKHLKVIDFGFARRWDGHSNLCEDAGTVHYMAPENVQKSFNDKADMWSLGITLFVMLKGDFPWADVAEESILQELVGKGPPKYWKRISAGLSEDAASLIKNLLSWSPAGRLSAAEVLEHKWIKMHRVPQAGFSPAIGHSLTAFAQADTLRRACLLLAARTLSAEEERPLREMFLELLGASDCTSHRGVVSESDVAKVMQASGVAPSEASELFLALNCGVRGGMSFSDFVAASLADKSAVDLSEASLYAAFDRFDTLGPDSLPSPVTLSFGAFGRCVRGQEPVLSAPDAHKQVSRNASGSSSIATATPSGPFSRTTSCESESDVEGSSACWSASSSYKSKSQKSWSPGLPAISEPTPSEVRAFVAASVANTNAAFAWVPGGSF